MEAGGKKKVELIYIYLFMKKWGCFGKRIWSFFFIFKEKKLVHDLDKLESKEPNLLLFIILFVFSSLHLALRFIDLFYTSLFIQKFALLFLTKTIWCYCII